jgi:predicted transcriptional regulator of viral defense system
MHRVRGCQRLLVMVLAACSHRQTVAFLPRLLEAAAEQHGLFTIAQAVGVAVPADQVRRLAVTGVVGRRPQGVYRINAILLNQYTGYMEAVLWARGRAD